MAKQSEKTEEQNKTTHSISLPLDKKTVKGKAEMKSFVIVSPSMDVASGFRKLQRKLLNLISEQTMRGTGIGNLHAQLETVRQQGLEAKPFTEAIDALDAEIDALDKKSNENIIETIKLIAGTDAEKIDWKNADLMKMQEAILFFNSRLPS